MEWDTLSREIREFIYRKLDEEATLIEKNIDDIELVDSRLVPSLVLIDIITGIEDITGFPVITDEVSLIDFTTVNKILKTVYRVYVQRGTDRG